MKRFLVLKEVWYPDAENGPEFDSQGFEPVADYDTEAEAQWFVSHQSYPQSYFIQDTDQDDGAPGSLDEGWPSDFGDYLDNHRDSDADHYDDMDPGYDDHDDDTDDYEDEDEEDDYEQEDDRHLEDDCC